MSRRDDLYAATHDFSLAMDGKIADHPLWGPVEARPRSRAIFLLHGYNTGGATAVRTLRAFRDRLDQLSPGIGAEAFVGTWAGRRWNGPLGYMKTIPFAVHSRDVLLRTIDLWCSGQYATEEVVLVAHSMGCRLVAETLRTMAARPNPRPAGLKRLIVVLMAPAIPVYMAETAGELDAALRLPDRLVLLHSEDDFILRRLFPPGQTLAGEGWFPEAVGLLGTGPHAACPREDVKPVGHLGYWASEAVVQKLLDILGLPALGSARRAPVQAAPPLRSAPLLAGAALPTTPPVGVE